MSVSYKTQALFEAIQNHDIRKAEELLQEGADPNRLLLNDVTPFHLAVAADSTSSIDYVQLILHYHGNPNVPSVDGITPLHVAAQWGKADCLMLLLQHGGNITLQDKDGNDVKWFAKDNEHCKLIIEQFLAEKDDSSDDETRMSPRFYLCPWKTEKKFECTASIAQSPLHIISMNSRHFEKHSALETPPIAVHEKNRMIDATSPDHCVFGFKSKQDHISDLNDATLMIPTSYSPVSLHASSVSSSFSSSSSNSYKYMTENFCKKMLQSTKGDVDQLQQQLQASCNFNRKLDKACETVSGQDNLYMSGDSTVPISDCSVADDVSTRECVYNEHTTRQLLPQNENDTSKVNPALTAVHSNDNLTEVMETNKTEGSEDGSEVVHFCDDDFLLVERIVASPSQSFVSEHGKDGNVPYKLSVSAEFSSDDTIIYDWRDASEISSLEEVDSTLEESVVISSHIENLNDQQLRNELLKHNFNPGPIRHCRKAYKKRLFKLDQGYQCRTTKKDCTMLFSHELRTILRGKSLPESVVDDDKMLRKQFDDPVSGQAFRGGSAKDCFNYLLLDPRVTNNLPERSKTMSEAETLKVFAAATFYVGKGKRSRPYAHFKEAIKDNKKGNVRKILHIREIWKSNGVISLHVFQNLVDCEAYTREAAMIEAFGLQHLTNKTSGKTYGVAEKWDKPRLRRYGTFLILSALQILLLEGERQIRPHQVSSKRK